MNTDLRDKIAAALYLFTEEADQGTPGWDELLANHGEDYETIVAYRAMADFVIPVVEREMAALDSISDADTQTAAAMASRALEAERKLAETRTELGRLRRETAAYRASVRAAHHSCGDCPDVAVESVESGCVCNGMASCEQCQERDAERARAGCDVCGKPTTHVTTPGGFRGCDVHFGGRP